MYVIFRALGKQFRAVQDGMIRIPTLEAEPGDKVEFDEVLLAERDGEIHVGAPALKGASVAAEVVAHGRGDKIIVYKMKRRKGHRKKQGHRQGYTDIRIVDITVPAGKPTRPVAKKKPAAPKPTAEPVAAAPAVAAPAAKKQAPVAAPAAKKEAPAAKQEAAPAPAPEAKAEKKPEPKAEAKAAPKPAAADIDITDAARALAEANGLDLATIKGTGKEGRILKSDIDKAIKAKDGD